MALSVAGGLAFPRIADSLKSVGSLTVVACLLAVTADTWPSSFPIRDAPRSWDVTAPPNVAAVMELPLGGAEFDAAAMYRAAFHGLPTVNGMSGYLTPHYEVLARAVAGRDPEALQAISAGGPVLLALDKRDGAFPSWLDYVRTSPAVRDVGEDERWRFFLLARRSDGPPLCSQRVIRPVTVIDAAGPVTLAPLVDDDPKTARSTKVEPSANEMLTMDFGGAAPLCGIGLSLGALAKDYPGRLVVELSLDGLEWSSAFDGSTAGFALAGALAQPVDARLEVPLMPVPARFVRLQVSGWSRSERWTLAELYARQAP